MGFGERRFGTQSSKDSDNSGYFDLVRGLFDFIAINPGHLGVNEIELVSQLRVSENPAVNRAPRIMEFFKEGYFYEGLVQAVFRINTILQITQVHNVLALLSTRRRPLVNLCVERWFFSSISQLISKLKRFQLFGSVSLVHSDVGLVGFNPSKAFNVTFFPGPSGAPPRKSFCEKVLSGKIFTFFGGN